MDICLRVLGGIDQFPESRWTVLTGKFTGEFSENADGGPFVMFAVSVEIEGRDWGLSWSFRAFRADGSHGR